jgi:hypothetical protein
MPAAMKTFHSAGLKDQHLSGRVPSALGWPGEVLVRRFYVRHEANW